MWKAGCGRLWETTPSAARAAHASKAPASAVSSSRWKVSKNSARWAARSASAASAASAPAAEASAASSSAAAAAEESAQRCELTTWKRRAQILRSAASCARSAARRSSAGHASTSILRHRRTRAARASICGLIDVSRHATASHSQQRLSSNSQPVRSCISGESARNECSRSHSVEIATRAGCPGHASSSAAVRSTRDRTSGSSRVVSAKLSPPNTSRGASASARKPPCEVGARPPRSLCTQPAATARLAARLIHR